MYIRTVHDKENLTFSVVVPSGHRRIVVWNDADVPQGGRGSSARADMNFCGFGLKMAETRRRTWCARIKKGIARIVRIIIVGLDSLSPSSTPVELSEIREGIILAISVNTKRRNKSV